MLLQLHISLLLMFLKIILLALFVIAVEMCSTMSLNMLVEILELLCTLHTGMSLGRGHSAGVIDVKIGNMCESKQNHADQVLL